MSDVSLVWLRSRGEIRGFALVDSSDYEIVRGRRWNRCSGYAVSTDREPMHRLVLGLTPDDAVWVHHLNENKADNRRANLVVCRSKSEANRLPHPKKSEASRRYHRERAAA